MWVFGGEDASAGTQTRLNETWAFNFGQCTFQAMAAPHTRSGLSAWHYLSMTEAPTTANIVLEFSQGTNRILTWHALKLQRTSSLLGIV